MPGHSLIHKAEYIGQLEGEIAAKSQEADELRIKNEELMAENTRLADLTRMLLSSSAFSTFLADLSGTGASNATQAARQLPSQGQNNNQVGLTVIPEESSFEYNATESANTGYTDNMDFGLYDAQVYAVTAVPEIPAVDNELFSNLHGKSSNFVGPYTSTDDSKHEPINIESMPTIARKQEMPEPIEPPNDNLDIDVSDPAFALFIDQPASPSTATPYAVASEDRIFGEIELEKAFGRVELIIEGDSDDSLEINAATVEKFERLCSRLDAASARIAAITPQ